MSQTKFQRFFELMVTQNEQLFDKFQVIHDSCVASNIRSDEFHKVGRDVLDIVHFWERKLCQGMERGNNAQFSVKVAEKFMSLVRARFSLIDQVGVFIKQAH